ncbi:hypothetical protein BTHERMOSOX_797 [Bathymodiolus thermophilus thioautotrophic gill symbiont]|nr:hypothetical protein THERMOT_1859 [Bathymodiolus thermophilus thioautotrophic gill symbiont]SHA05346.1 hypothetical protein BTHERMOSOX_797 [Bathymodiolus thermophilus thioautotrophic gill symbiont]
MQRSLSIKLTSNVSFYQIYLLGKSVLIQGEKLHLAFKVSVFYQ